MSKSHVGMIRVDGNERDPVLVGNLPTGSFAYFDRDWLPGRGQPVPSLLVHADGSLSWCGGPPIKTPSRVDPDTAAALVLLTVAHEAAVAVEDLAPESVEVSGSGLIARRVRAVLGGAQSDRRGHRRCCGDSRCHPTDRRFRPRCARGGDPRQRPVEPLSGRSRARPLAAWCLSAARGGRRHIRQDTG
jgi:hypothetical protein